MMSNTNANANARPQLSTVKLFLVFFLVAVMLQLMTIFKWSSGQNNDVLNAPDNGMQDKLSAMNAAMITANKEMKDKLSAMNTAIKEMGDKLSAKENLLVESESRTLTVRGDENKQSLLDVISYVSFPMNRSTGQLDLPESIQTVMIDVGARGSDYLTTMENTEDKTTALFLFDPLPDSGIPLNSRVTDYALRGRGKKWLDSIKKNQVFYTRAAMGEKEDMTEFNVAAGPACGSILQTSDQNKFWCAGTSKKISTMILTMKDFLRLVPKGTSSISQVHLKVDAEGADLAVLRGAGDLIDMLDTVVIECKADTNEKVFREGECVAKDAVKYMVEERKFKLFEVEGQGGLVNIYWVNSKFKGPMPKFLLQGSLNFYKRFYKHLDESWLKENNM